MKSIARICFILVTALTMAAYSAHAQADSSTSTTTNKAPAAPKPRAKRGSGTIASVDSDAKTITFTLASGETQVVKITSKTKLKKDGQAATLSDFAAGQKATFYSKKNDAGDNEATSVTVGMAKKPAAASTPPATTTPPADNK
jgi:hypothetical protein